MKEAFEKIKDLLYDNNVQADQKIEGLVDDIMYIVSEVEAEYGNGWIPCDGRKMPKADERVLCLHDDGFIDCGELVGESWCCDMDEYAIDRTCVVAWHPLPEAYRRESK